jgi:lipopolysaccharide export system protein LptA
MLFKSLAVIVPLFAYLFFTHVYIFPKDIEQYQTLTAHHKEIQKRRELTLVPAEQHKKTVQKDIWLPDGRHVTIASDLSHLTVSQKENQIEITEAMEQVRATLPDGLFISSDRGTYTSLGNELQLLGHVRLISPQEPMVATAETLTYNLQEQSACLKSSSRVLFWKEGLAMAAPEVILHADKTASILGDVRVQLDLDEQQTIHQLIEQYL